MYTKSRRLILRTPAVALLTAIALSFLTGPLPTDTPGLVTGAAGAAYFDPASLADAFGCAFTVAPADTFEAGWRTACNAVELGRTDRLIFCLDGSEAASAYTAFVPQNPDDTEKIGALSVYLQDRSHAFTADDTSHSLDLQADVLDRLTALRDLCAAEKVTLTVLFLPLHESRLQSINANDLTAYKTALTRLTDLWDFSCTDLSGDARYFYTKDCARRSTLDLVLDKMTGKPVPFENFGTLLKRSNAASAALQPAYPAADDYTKEVPILLYHHLTEHPVSRADISPATFRSHMEALKTAGYTAVTAADMIAYVEEGKPLPPKPVWITFDDGYTSNYTLAYPILSELGLKATVFAIGSSIGHSTYKDTAYPITPHFSAQQAEEMMASGVIEVQSHTWDLHQHVPYESGAARTTAKPLAGESTADYLAALRLDHEIYESRTGRDFYALAYPKGQYTRESEQLYHTMGIKLTVSTTTDRKNILVRGLPQSLYALCRFDIPEGMSPDSLLTLIG